MRFDLLLALIVLSLPALAEDEVFLCRKDSEVLYTSTPPAGYQCEVVRLNVIRPSPEAVERQERANAQRAERLRRLAEEDRLERLVRAREMEAEAARLRARSDAEETRYLRFLLEQESYRRDDYYDNSYLWLVPGRFFSRRPRPPGSSPGRDTEMNPPPSSDSAFNPPFGQ